MIGWPFVAKVVEALFDGAIRLDRYLDERKGRKPAGLSFKDVQHQRDQMARGTRSRAPTVAVRRPP